MSYFDDILEKGKDKSKGKEGKEAIKFLKEHKKDLEGLGKDMLVRMLAHVGMGEPERAKNLYLIRYQSPEELIAGVEKSGEVSLEAHKKMEAEVARINAMWQNVGQEAARQALAVVVAMV